MFQQIKDIIVSRAVRSEVVENAAELVGFADGSLMAYACAVCVNWKKVKQSLMDPDRFHV